MTPEEQIGKLTEALTKSTEAVTENNRLLTRSILLLDKLVKLFEQYDADVFLEEETQREIHGSPNPRRG